MRTALVSLALLLTPALAFAQGDPRTPEEVERDAAKALDPAHAYASSWVKLFAIVVVDGGAVARPESPGLKSLYRFYEGQGFRMTAVLPDGHWGGLEYGDATDFVVDRWGYHAKRLGVTTRPTALVYDRSGKVTVYGSLADLERTLGETFGAGPRPFGSTARATPQRPADEARPRSEPAATTSKLPEPSAAKLALPAGAIAAVLDMADPNAADGKLRIEPRILRDLTEHLRISLASGGVQTVERSQIVAQMKSDSYKACYDESCQIPLGKALAASVIVRSRITRFAAKRCAVTAEVVDLKKEVAIGAAKADSNCSVESLVDAVADLARQLAGR
ncbi:hypothetical protein L6R52_27325 [Myxococcota bacterium]|nr:hypothetical protein [Myxococcota bacterium]